MEKLTFDTDEDRYLIWFDNNKFQLSFWFEDWLEVRQRADALYHTIWDFREELDQLWEDNENPYYLVYNWHHYSDINIALQDWWDIGLQIGWENMEYWTDITVEQLKDIQIFLLEFLHDARQWKNLKNIK